MAVPPKCKHSRKRAEQRGQATTSAEEPLVCRERGGLSQLTCEGCALRVQLHDLLSRVRAQAEVFAGLSRKDRRKPCWIQQVRAVESRAEQLEALARHVGDEGLLAMAAEIQLHLMP